MTKKRHAGNWDMPLLHQDHPRPVTRRQFLSQGFLSGAAYTVGGIATFLNPRNAHGALAPDLDALRDTPCNITDGAGKIPFICFDLAGGANIAGSNVLVGQQGGQSDFLSTQGYEKMGLPGDMVPGLTDTDGNDFANFDLGLGFHFDSAFRRGILSKVSAATAANINGAVIPARSDNDTGNNPHNPMYGIALAGAKGSILTLAGSENTDSGGNSMLPAALYDPELRPTKVDRPSDVVNLVDTGDLVGILSKEDATKVMESIYRLSDQKMFNVETLVNADADIDRAVRCGYLKAADIADRFGGTPIDPGLDTDIVADTGSIFTTAEFTAGDRDAREQRQPARQHGHPQLHGPARRAGTVPVPARPEPADRLEPRTGQRPRPLHRVRAHRQRHHSSVGLTRNQPGMAPAMHLGQPPPVGWPFLLGHNPKP